MKKVPSIMLFLFVIGVFPAFTRQSNFEPTLKTGDPAPPLNVIKWLKGEPVTEFKKGHIYVVEFWATWCAPCRKGMPHLAELAEKYRGKVTVLSINIWETSRIRNKDIDYMPNVERFVKNMGDAMDFVVGADGQNGDIAKAWMVASRGGGIPRAFVIGKDGTLIWHGAPAEGLSEILEIATDSEWNEDARKLAEKRIQENKDKINKLTVTDYGDAIRAKDYSRAIRICEEINALTPHSFNGVHFATWKYILLTKHDSAKAKAYAPQFLATYKKSPLALQELANSILGTSINNMVGNIAEKDRDYSFAMALLQAAARLSDPQDPVLLSSLAEASFRTGNKTKAVEYQEAALKYLATSTLEIPEARKTQYQQQLDTYKKL